MKKGFLHVSLLAERKNPPDKRVAFTPEQCKKIEAAFPEIRFSIETSPSRCISDSDFLNLNIPIASPGESEVLFGIKEVPVDCLIPGKTYFFFSHTIKKQSHNRKLLQALLAKKIEMVDYECLTDASGQRTVAFGRFAGIVGAYNGIRLWLRKLKGFSLPAASLCRDMQEMQQQIIPYAEALKGLKITVTGTGRVGKGAVEVLRNAGIQELDPESYSFHSGEQPVFTVLSSKHYLRHKHDLPWDEADFRRNPENYESSFLKFAQCSDLLIPCHFWDPKAPALFSMVDLSNPEFRISVISDVSCDIEGSIPTTLRASSIADPFYDVDRHSGKECPAFSTFDTISVCAVDNLPCELPLDASKAFGDMLMEHVIPELNREYRPSIEHATICRDGKLMPRFAYLQEFADGDHA